MDFPLTRPSRKFTLVRFLSTSICLTTWRLQNSLLVFLLPGNPVVLRERALERSLRISLLIIAARKRSLRRLCLYTCLLVILLGGEGSASVHDGIHTPSSRHPPGSRHPPEADIPSPGSRHPCAVHAGRYGQQAGGTHPTRCILVFFLKPSYFLFDLFLEIDERFLLFLEKKSCCGSTNKTISVYHVHQT